MPSLLRYIIDYSQYGPYTHKMGTMKDTEIRARLPLSLTERRLDNFLERVGAQIQTTSLTPEGNVQVTLEPATPSLEELFAEPETPAYTVPDSIPAHIRAVLPDPVTPPEASYSVDSSTGWNGRTRTTYSLLTRIYLSPAIKRPINLRVPHASGADYQADGDFTVQVWSTPVDNGRSASVPRRIKGNPVGCTDDGYPASGLGIPLVMDGYCYGELFQNALYIHFDAVHHGYEADHMIYALLMNDAAKVYLETDFSKMEAEIAKKRAEMEEESLRKFATLSLRRFEKRNAAEISSLEDKIRSLRTQLFEAERAYLVCKAEGKKDSVVESVLEEFRKLKEGFANIQDAKFDGSYLTVTTGPLNANCKRSGNDYYLGRVRIKLPFDGGSTVYMHHAEPECRRMPHTGGSGDVCLGSASEEVHGYLSNYEMLAAVSFMVAFLENGIDTGDEWGVNLRNFPNLGQESDG